MKHLGRPSVKLREYQENLISKAVEIVRSHGFVYLALETRTGKTPVSIMTACAIAGDAGILFVTKASIISSIKDTYSQLCSDYPIGQIPFAVISFDSLHKVTHIPGRVIIADEAHSFGSYPKPSKRATMLFGISRGCKVIMLSATPTPESYSSIYWQLAASHVNSPLITPYKNFYAWAKAGFVNIKQKRIGTGQYANDYSNANKDMILPLFQSLLITYTQKEAGFQQTEISEQVITVPMPEEIGKLIKALKKDGVCYFQDRQIIGDRAVSRMSKIHQLCSGTVIPEPSAKGDKGTGVIVSTHKLKVLDVIMSIYPKIAIFYKYIAELDMLKEEFGDRLTDDYRVFESEQDRIFAGQFISKREGIDLKSADAIVCINIDFAWLSYAQMINRMMSYDRTKAPKLIWIFTTGGIEERVYKTVKAKKTYTSAYYRRWENSPKRG